MLTTEYGVYGNANSSFNAYGNTGTLQEDEYRSNNQFNYSIGVPEALLPHNVSDVAMNVPTSFDHRDVESTNRKAKGLLSNNLTRIHNGVTKPPNQSRDLIL